MLKEQNEQFEAKNIRHHKLQCEPYIVDYHI